jgi:hypothetical protein
MNVGQAHCPALRAPTPDLWLEITKSKKCDSGVHLNHKILISSSYLTASQNGKKKKKKKKTKKKKKKKVNR